MTKFYHNTGVITTQISALPTDVAADLKLRYESLNVADSLQVTTVNGDREILNIDPVVGTTLSTGDEIEVITTTTTISHMVFIWNLSSATFVEDIDRRLEKLNTPQSWGVNLGEFETGSWGNIIGTFKSPSTHVANFTENNVYDKARAFYNLAQAYIDGVVSLNKKVLNKIKFRWLGLEKDKRELRELIYEAVQHAVQNREVWEKINTSTMQSGGLNVNNENTGWLLTIDMFGKRAWSKLNNSDIKKYDIVHDGEIELYKRTKNGNIEVIGHFDDSEELQ